MMLMEASKRLERAEAVCSSPDATPSELRSAIGAITELQGFIDARLGELLRALDAFPTAFAEATLTETTGCSLNEASRRTERAATLGDSMGMHEALSDGAISSAHVDALTRNTRNLDQSAKDTLLNDPDLAAAASRSSVRQFDAYVKRKARALDDTDPDETFARQQRATSLKTFTDVEGMWNLHAKFDPLTGAKIAKQLQSAKAAKFAESTPDTAPRDPRDRAAHLEALALAHLIAGGTDAESGTARSGPRPGAPLVVIDATQTNGTGGPVTDWGIPAEVPSSVLTDILGAHTPDVVIVANGLVLHAPGRLDLARTSRLASRDQRRALTGLYSTCAVPHCDTHVDRCRLHHIQHWEHGGDTNLANLLPVCQHHHTLLHENNWNITLGPNRELTIQLPDGHTMRTGPPRRGSP